MPNKLKDLLVEIVSIVDKPATRKGFLLLKNDKGKGGEKKNMKGLLKASGEEKLNGIVSALDTAVGELKDALDSNEKKDIRGAFGSITRIVRSFRAFLGGGKYPSSSKKAEEKFPYPKTDEDRFDLGAAIKDARDDKELRLDVVAEMSGKPYDIIARMEEGGPFDHEVYEEVAKILDLPSILALEEEVIPFSKTIRDLTDRIIGKKDVYKDRKELDDAIVNLEEAVKTLKAVRRGDEQPMSEEQATEFVNEVINTQVMEQIVGTPQ